MRTLGIIGGVGPESTVDYYRSIIAAYREKKADGSYPQFLINSIDLKKELDLIVKGELDQLTRYLLEEIAKLARAGADFGIIASNTPHLVFDAVARQSPIPLISIVEATSAEAKRRGLERLALFGTRFTMQGTFYPDVFSRNGLQLILPSAESQEFIHDKYMNELVNGIFLPQTKARLVEIIERMKNDNRIDAVILGGTELPLILRDETYAGVAVLNTTKIHVATAIAEMFE